MLGGHAFNFFRAVENAKIELSSEAATSISFRRPRINVQARVSRTDFEDLICRNLDRIDAQIERALRESDVKASDVDLVIRTGGSSRIPAFVERLADRFGEDRLAERDAFTTVALGLGIRACELWG